MSHPALADELVHIYIYIHVCVYVCMYSIDMICIQEFEDNIFKLARVNFFVLSLMALIDASLHEQIYFILIICLHIVKWFQVLLRNTNNLI